MQTEGKIGFKGELTTKLFIGGAGAPENEPPRQYVDEYVRPNKYGSKPVHTRIQVIKRELSSWWLQWRIDRGLQPHGRMEGFVPNPKGLLAKLLNKVIK